MTNSYMIIVNKHPIRSGINNQIVDRFIIRDDDKKKTIRANVKTLKHQYPTYHIETWKVEETW